MEATDTRCAPECSLAMMDARCVSAATATQPAERWWRGHRFQLYVHWQGCNPAVAAQSEEYSP